MASELVYTSADQGLKPQTHGFCTVAMTRGLARNITERLEGLSGYRAHFAAHDPMARSNPVNYSYYRFTIGGRACPILSRVSYAGFDYTGRSNKLAHHVVLDEGALPIAGPTRLSLQPGFFLRSWSGTPAWLEQPKAIPDPARTSCPAQTWQQVAGDSGWAGVVAEHTLAAPLFPGRPKAPVAILYKPGFDSDQFAADAGRGDGPDPARAALGGDVQHLPDRHADRHIVRLAVHAARFAGVEEDPEQSACPVHRSHQGFAACRRRRSAGGGGPIR